MQPVEVRRVRGCGSGGGSLRRGDGAPEQGTKRQAVYRLGQPGSHEAHFVYDDNALPCTVPALFGCLFLSFYAALLNGEE